MKTLLLSSGSSINTPLIFESHFDLKLKKARVAYIPHAKDYLPVKEREKGVNESLGWIKQNVKFVDLINLYDQRFSDKEWLNKYDVIWVGGGMVGYLRRAFFDTGFDKQLNRLMKQGMKYLGSSAGSMITSATLATAGWYPNEEEPEVANKSGLGWLPFEMFPHYVEPKHLDLIKENLTEPIILLPENSAIGLEGRELRFYNQARILIN